MIDEQKVLPLTAKEQEYQGTCGGNVQSAARPHVDRYVGGQEIVSLVLSKGMRKADEGIVSCYHLSGRVEDPSSSRFRFPKNLVRRKKEKYLPMI